MMPQIRQVGSVSTILYYAARVYAPFRVGCPLWLYYYGVAYKFINVQQLQYHGELFQSRARR
jgi:hypothetical protein